MNGGGPCDDGTDSENCGGAGLQQFYGVTRYTVTVGMEGISSSGTLAGKDFNALVVLLGTNDLRPGQVDVVISRYIPLLEELDTAYDKPIFVQRLFPVGARYHGFAEETPESRSAELAQVNAWLEAYCAEREGLTFIDCTEGFVDENGLLIHSLADGVHMDPAYFDMFYDNIARALCATGLVA